MLIPWGVSSIHNVIGIGIKKTGCRRRKVIKEDLVAQEDEAVEDMVSSSLKGPYFSAANGFRRGLAMAGLKWSSNSNNTLLTILPSTTSFEKFVLLAYSTTSFGAFGVNWGSSFYTWLVPEERKLAAEEGT